MKLFIYIIVILITLSTKSYAYLDPGSDGVFQVFLASTAGIFASLLIYWYKSKNLLAKIFEKKKANEEQD
tara:strand:- start:125 stop:334 length:210 start_codon:yes stop_codon:yes gene_type:complete